MRAATVDEVGDWRQRCCQVARSGDSPSAEALLDDELIAPDLLFAEVANALWKKRQRGEMDAVAASA